MGSESILIAGCGDVGQLLAGKLLQQDKRVFGLTRQPHRLLPGIHPITANLNDPDSLLGLPEVDQVVYCAATRDSSDAGYRAVYIDGVHNLLQALPSHPKLLLFTSSTAVYAQDDHSWVDENSPTEPTSFRGQRMLEAEAQIHAQPFPTSVVRFSGIYGENRNYFLRSVAKGQAYNDSPPHYSNRIHRQDAAGVLAHLLAMADYDQPLEPIYLASDEHPAPLHEVANWLAERLGVELTEPCSLHRAGSKRCSPQRLLDSGYRFRFPSYQDGYPAMIEDWFDS